MSSRYQVTPMQYALETADSNTCFLQELRGEQDLRPQPWWLPSLFWRVSPGWERAEVTECVAIRPRGEERGGGSEGASAIWHYCRRILTIKF